MASCAAPQPPSWLNGSQPAHVPQALPHCKLHDGVRSKPRPLHAEAAKKADRPLPTHDVTSCIEHSPPTTCDVSAHDESLHVRRGGSGDGDCQARRHRRDEHQTRALLPPVRLAQLRLEDVVGGHFGGAQHRRASHGGAQALVQPHGAVPRNHLPPHLHHRGRRELLGRRHLNHEEVRGGRDGGGAGTGDEPRDHLLPHRQVLFAVAGVQRHLEGLVQSEPQAAVGGFAQRGGGEAAVQPAHALGAPDGGRLLHHAHRLLAAHARKLLLHHRRARPVHRALRRDAARAHQAKVQPHLKGRQASRRLYIVPRRSGGSGGSSGCSGHCCRQR
mmetsp:Transcript_38427/g.95333  ORF Transcript_38427/g.95333 Transcript_38427/m.95333 type:complete len:330 (-) Transcript_38427:152-1141(-)